MGRRRENLKQDILSASEKFADAFSLPKDMIANATLIHMVGKSDVFVENFKGIISYSCNEIVIKGQETKYSIIGERMTIKYYSNEDMKISGYIKEICIK